MIPTRSESSAASSMSCVVRSIVTPLAFSSLEPVPHEEPRRRVEAGRRLVEEEHLRRVHQRARDHHALRLAAREEVRLDARRGRAGRTARGSRRRAPRARAPGRRGRRRGRSGCRGSRSSGRGCCAAAPPRAAPRAAPGPRRRRRRRSGPSLRGASHRRQDPDGRRLPGAVRAEEAEDLAALGAEARRRRRR